MMTTTTQPARSPSASRAGRRRHPAVYAVAAGAVVVLGVSALAAVGRAITQEDQTTFAADGVRELVIDQDSGNVSLVAGTAAGHLQVTSSRRWSWQAPTSEHTVKDGVLTLTGNCPVFSALGSCDVDRRVSVPPGIKVRIDLSAGNVQAAGLNLASFGVSTASGSIDATDMDVSTFSATTSSGSVHAGLSGAPHQIEAQTSSGDIRITVPDTLYRVDAGASAGQVRITVDEDPSSARFITAHSSSGDVTISHG